MLVMVPDRVPQKQLKKLFYSLVKLCRAIAFLLKLYFYLFINYERYKFLNDALFLHFKQYTNYDIPNFE